MVPKSCCNIYIGVFIVSVIIFSSINYTLIMQLKKKVNERTLEQK